MLEPLSGDLALTAALVADPALNGESFNFGPRAEQNRTVLALLRDMAEIWGFTDGAAACEALPEPPFAEAALLKLNCDKALMHLGWEPTLAYAECVRMTASWYHDVLKSDADPFATTTTQIRDYVDLARQRDRVWTGVIRP